MVTLNVGGADSLYTYIGSSDLRPYNLTSGAKYMIQAIHTTLVMRYNDTLDFVVASTSSSPPLFTVLRVRATSNRTVYYGLKTWQMFSVSQIQGALCDEGQNYKNIVGLIKGLGKICVVFRFKAFAVLFYVAGVDYVQRTVFGCAVTFG